VQVNWNQEQCDRCRHGNAGVVHAVDIVGQQWLEDPGRRCQHEHHGDHFFGTRHRPECGHFLFEQTTAVAPREAKTAAGERPPDEDQHADAQRQAQQHPLAEADLDVVVLPHERRQQGIGRGADERSDAADAGRTGDAQQQRHGEPRAFLFLAAGDQQADDRQADGQHHDAGRRIAHPHTDERRGDHEAGDLPARLVTHRQQRRQGDAFVQVPALHRQAEQKTAEEEKDGRVGVGRGGLGQGIDVDQGYQQNRQQRGRRDRYRLGRPPDRHQRGQAHGQPGLFRKAAGWVGQDAGQQQQWAQDQADPRGQYGAPALR